MSIRSRVGVEVRDGNVEKALSVFKSKVKRCGILKKYKENQEFKKPSTEKRHERQKRRYKQQKSEKS